jgi:hypothetical protein
MRVCDICRSTDQEEDYLREISLHIEDSPGITVNEVCPTCIEKIKLLLKPPPKPKPPKFNYRGQSGFSDWDNVPPA